MDFPNLLMAAPLLDRLQGRRVQRITWNGPVLAMVFDGDQVLLLHLHQGAQGLHLDTRLQEEFEHIRFQDQRHDFSFLPPHLEGASFLGGWPLRGQSLLRLDFGASGNFKDFSHLQLYVEFYAGGRVVLCGADQRVVRATRKGGAEHRPGALYTAGEAAPVVIGQDLPLAPADFAGWPPALLERVRRGGELPLAEEDCRGVRGFKPDSLRYLAERPEPHPREDPGAVLARRLARWVERVRQGREPVHVLSFPAGSPQPCRIRAFPLPAGPPADPGAEPQDVFTFEDYPSALNFMGRGCLARQQMTELMATLRQGLEERRRHNRRLLARLEADWERAAAGGDLRRQADTLASHLHALRRGLASVTLPDVHGGERPLEIALDPARSPQENLGRLYQRAAKGERGLQTVELRLEEVRRRVVEDEEMLQDRLPALANCRCRNLAEIAALREELLRLGHAASLLDLRSPTPGARPQPAARPYRRYLLPGGWEVLVGRNNRENDELTHREAASGDLWFHAGGAAGSHVILRTGGHRGAPPKAVLEATAAIAAFHSKARHSGLVPVIYTEKRYVRKPRKGAPGLALCTRERTLMVKPEVPGSGSPAA